MPRPPSQSIGLEFQPFSDLHLGVVAACILLIAAACSFGRCHRETGRERRFRHGWGWFVLGWQFVAFVWWLLPGNYELESSLPLHICDLVGFIAGPALITGARPLRTMLYFWGLGLSTQAFVTPTLREGPADPIFWLFWILHLQIIGSAVYDLVVGGYRPRFGDFLLACGVSALYAAAVIPLNLIFEINYGYLGKSTPDRPTLLDRLGPWPVRPFKLMAGVAVWFALIWLVWPATAAVVRVLGGRAAA